MLEKPLKLQKKKKILNDPLKPEKKFRIIRSFLTSQSLNDIRILQYTKRLSPFLFLCINLLFFQMSLWSHDVLIFLKYHRLFTDRYDVCKRFYVAVIEITPEIIIIKNFHYYWLLNSFIFIETHTILRRRGKNGHIWRTFCHLKEKESIHV